MSHIKGKRLVITGMSKGIGKAIAQLALESGMKVVGWGLTDPGFTHKSLDFTVCDVSQESHVKAAATITLKKHGPADFLINNAGLGHFSQIQDFSPEQFKRMWEVNVWGAFLVTQALVPGMQEQGKGHIINISSIAGRVGAPWGAGYNASNFGLSGMGESLFHELRKQGIKVTNVYPGSIATNFFDEIDGMETNKGMLDPEEVARTVVHVMDTSRNFLIREIEVRPLDSKWRG